MPRPPTATELRRLADRRAEADRAIARLRFFDPANARDLRRKLDDGRVSSDLARERARKLLGRLRRSR